MFRKAISKIMQASVNAAAGVQRPLSRKIPESVDWVKTGNSRDTGKSSEAFSSGLKSSPKSKKKSRKNSDKKKLKTELLVSSGSKPLLVEKSEKNLHAETISKNQSYEPIKAEEVLKRIPCQENVRESTSNEPKKNDFKSSRNPEINCTHRKNLLPPGFDLTKLKSFELKTTQSNFYIKTTGFDQ